MSKVDFKPLLEWSKKNYSHLPWRTHRSLYGTLVSEIMLQQTTVGTVLNYFLPFLKKYPTISRLAQASEEEILIAWKGLGYYRRAKNLRNAAVEIETRFNGEIPKEKGDQLSIKGIGEYTANALHSIGDNKKALSVDANIERVIARIYKIAPDRKKIGELFLRGEILESLKDGNARDYNESLMDLGREICTAKKALCDVCPVNRDCNTYKSGTKILFTSKEKKSRVELLLLRLIKQKNGKTLFYLKGEQEWLSGQWELPTFILKCSEDLHQYPKLKKEIKEGKSFKSSITRYNITNKVILSDQLQGLDLTPFKKAKFLLVTDDLNISTSSKKALKLLKII